MTTRLITILAFCAALVAPPSWWVGSCHAANGQTPDLGEQLEVQIERTKAIRDKADTAVNLARLRIAQQLERSQEELSQQLELLQRLRDQLAEQINQAQVTAQQLQSAWSERLRKAAGDVENQISILNTLLNRMDALRIQVGGDDVSVDQPSTGDGTSGLPTENPTALDTTTVPTMGTDPPTPTAPT
jgi:hypothetical protein